MDIFYRIEIELGSHMQGYPLQRYLDQTRFNRCISRIEISSFHQVMRPNAHAAPYMYIQTYYVGVTSESRVKCPRPHSTVGPYVMIYFTYNQILILIYCHFHQNKYFNCQKSVLLIHILKQMVRFLYILPVQNGDILFLKFG